MSTAYDLMRQNNVEKGSREVILRSFSLYENGKFLFNTTKRRGNSIDCLDGIRFLSICWIIYGHNYYVEVIGVKLDLTSVPVVRECTFFFNYVSLNNIVKLSDARKLGKHFIIEWKPCYGYLLLTGWNTFGIHYNVKSQKKCREFKCPKDVLLSLHQGNTSLRNYNWFLLNFAVQIGIRLTMGFCHWTFSRRLSPKLVDKSFVPQ